MKISYEILMDVCLLETRIKVWLKDYGFEIIAIFERIIAFWENSIIEKSNGGEIFR